VMPMSDILHKEAEPAHSSCAPYSSHLAAVHTRESGAEQYS
jgi:hypothetical protein